MVHRASVPGNQLSIDATTDDNFWVLGAELNSWDFNWCLQGELSKDDLTVGKIENQHLRLERFAHHFGTLLEAQLLNDAHSN